jgi:hypothetical protein
MSIRAQPGRQMILVHFEQKMKSVAIGKDDFE